MQLKGLDMADPEVRYNEMMSKLKENNQKLTPQRLAILRILSGSEGHPSVEEIHQKLARDFPGISQATVYRTIMMVKSLGEVLELGFADGSNRYDGNRPDPHPHVICTRCKKIIDPTVSNLLELPRKIAEETGFEIVTYRLDIFGICPQCQAQS
jgi:Fur family transcriptional regulator, peroxide stress response regulator